MGSEIIKFAVIDDVAIAVVIIANSAAIVGEGSVPLFHGAPIVADPSGAFGVGYVSVVQIGDAMMPFPNNGRSCQ